MTEYECGFIDGIKSKVTAELTPTLIDISKTMSEMLMPVISTALENALNDNNAIPAADVQPVKHGEWKHVAGMNSKCSVCSHYFPVSEFDSRPFDINFCPNCGARMDGDTDA